MTALRAWFAGRTLRERILIGVMAALAGMLVVWGGIVLPVRNGLESARERQDDAALRLADTRARVAALTDLSRARPPALPGGMAAAVRASADAAGFTLQTVNEVGPGRVQVGLSSARGGALMAWVSRLEAGGVLVETMRLTDNGDRTLAAQMTLRARPA